MRCNCPNYHVPSADPHDSKGCPVHDPDYVDPQIEIRRLREENARLRKTHEEDTIQVVMLGVLRPAFEDWLEARGLELFRIPQSNTDDLPTFGVGII